MLDEPLFLSQDGVRAVVGTSVDLQRNLQPRSDLIDPKLLQEPHLEDAQAVVLGDRYYLFIEGHVYVADARLRREDELGQIQYEWHYWEGIPAFSVFSDGKDLWFGSKEGYVYRMLKETEKRCYLDDGAPIQCRWTTPFFSFGCWDRKKTLTEISVTMLPFTKSSCQICYATQGHSEQVQEEVVEDILGFEDVDFNRFTFKTLRFPHTHRIRSREKRFQLFRLTLRNQDTGQGEGFGLVAIQMSCRLSSKIK